jgi:hypothetical protein
MTRGADVYQNWFRLYADYSDHAKVLALVRKLGPLGEIYPVRMMQFLARCERAEGIFAEEGEVEQAARWTGEPGVLVAALRAVGILDGLTYHGWADRSGPGIVRMVSDRSKRKPCGNPGGFRRVTLPSKSLSKSLNANGVSGRPKNTSPEGFEAFWEAWPSHYRKANKAACAKRWQNIPVECHPEIALKLQAWKRSDKWASGEYVPAPLVWLNQERWKAEAPPAVTAREPQRTVAIAGDRKIERWNPPNPEVTP